MEPLVRTEAATRWKGLVKQALAPAWSLGRRHVSKLLYLLALLGVPAALITVSGGMHTIGFWIVAVVWLVAVAYGVILVSFIALLVLSPLALILGGVVTDGVRAVIEKVARVVVVLAAGGLFVAAARLGDTSGVRLPGPWPNVGALVMITAAVLASYGLWSLARRLKPPKRVPGYERRHSVTEPDDVYWSDQYVVGWRAWNWDGSSLRGVYARWSSEMFEATCSQCDEVPSWDHLCGVYAAKRPADVHVFYGGSWIIGRVEMWGDVIEHERGYRASHARITHLWVGDPWRAERIRDAYPTVDVEVGSHHANRKVA